MIYYAFDYLKALNISQMELATFIASFIFDQFDFIETSEYLSAVDAPTLPSFTAQ